MDFSNRDFLINWLLGFGGKVKVLEPSDVVDGLKTAAKNILSNYE
jgi:predicted DNA-binding transcriptional regulator YafY